MPDNVSVSFPASGTANLPITADTNVTVDTNGIRANTLNLNTAAGTGPFTVSLTLPTGYSGYTDQLVVGSGIKLNVTTSGRWAINAANANETNITVANHLTYSTPTITGSLNGPNNVIVQSNASVGTITGGNAADSFTINGRITSLSTGSGNDQVTLGQGGQIGTLNFGAGANTLTTSGNADITTVNFAGSGPHVANFGGTGDVGTVNLGAGSNELRFTGATHVDVVNAAAGTGPTLIQGPGSIGRIAAAAGDDFFTIIDTDFSQSLGTTQISTGLGNDSLTFTGDVGLSNLVAATAAIDTGGGDDTIRVTAGGRLSTSGLTRNIRTGDGNDLFTLEAGAAADISTLDTGAGDDQVTLGPDSRFEVDIDTGDGADRVTLTQALVEGEIKTGNGDDIVTITDSRVTDDIDTGSGNDSLTLSQSETGALTMGDGNDTLVIRDSHVTGDIDMGDGTDSLTISQSSAPPVLPEDLAAHYAANPAATVTGDIDLGSGGGLKTLTIEDGVRISGTITAGKLLTPPVTSHVEIGNYVTLDDTEYSLTLGHGDDVITIGHSSFVSGQILMNGGNNSLIVYEGSSLSSSNVAIYGGTGNDHVTLHDNVIVKGAIALSAGSNTLMIGNNVTLSESGTVYSSADTGEGGQDTIRFGKDVAIRGNIYTGWGSDIVYMTEGAVGLHDSAGAIISGGEGGEDDYGDMLVVGSFLPESAIAGNYTLNAVTGLWHANREIDESFTYNGINYRNFETIKFVVPTCFTPGTLIATAKGLMPVEDIRVGDLVLTRDNGLQKVRKILRSSFDSAHLAAQPRHLPVRIAAGALGGGLPLRDLVVSPQHRVLVTSRIAKQLIDSSEVLLPAVQLCGWPGIARLEVGEVTYLHLVFTRHELITSEGAVTEAFYPGPGALNGMDQATRTELTEIFPDLADPAQLPRALARPELRGPQARKLLARHRKHNRPLMA